MKCNVGGIDRILRLVVGFALVASNFLVPAINPWGYVGLILIGTAAISWCPIYRVLGLKTCKADPKEG